MIEYILLFGLGFLSAGLAGLLIAPSIHRSIVRFTENRLRATMPFSPQEVRAQKDMVRAVLAAENARTGHDLSKERDKIAGLMVQNDTLTRQIGQAVSDRAEMISFVNEMKQETATLRTQIEEDNEKIEKLKQANMQTEVSLAELQFELEDVSRHRLRLMSDLDNLKIDMVARQTEIESLNLRVKTLREERDNARKEGKSAIDRTKDLELRLVREENKVFRLEERLQRDASSLADKSNSLDRRSSEIIRLKERLKETTWEAREAIRALKAAGLPVPEPTTKKGRVELVSSRDEPIEGALSDDNAVNGAETLDANKQAVVFDAARFADEVRAKNNALTQLLLNGSADLKDDALRDEIASIAAEMVVLTASKEGAGSPIRTILAANAGKSASGRLSLAERATKALQTDLGG